jgi:Phage integrase family
VLERFVDRLRLTDLTMMREQQPSRRATGSITLPSGLQGSIPLSSGPCASMATRPRMGCFLPGISDGVIEGSVVLLVCGDPGSHRPRQMRAPAARLASRTRYNSPRPRRSAQALARWPEARLDPGFSGHVLRHTFGTRLVRDGHDLVLVAELMGHARTETTRGCSLPTAADVQAASTACPQTADQRLRQP